MPIVSCLMNALHISGKIFNRFVKFVHEILIQIFIDCRDVVRFIPNRFTEYHAFEF